MPSVTPSSLAVKEGLIKIVPADRFQAKPRSGANTRVVVMERKGNALRHYATLHSPSERLSIGEALWGRYECWVVDMSQRRLRIKDEVRAGDKVTDVGVDLIVYYQVFDVDRVALGVDDALEQLRQELLRQLGKEIKQADLGHLDEDALERRLLPFAQSAGQGRGFQISRLQLDLHLDQKTLERLRKYKEEDADRQRSTQLEFEDVDHIEQLMSKLGLANLPPDVRMRLLSQPRTEAYREIIGLFAEERQHNREIGLEQRRQAFELIRTMIADGTIEEMDLESFKTDLLAGFAQSSKTALGIGQSPLGLLGSAGDTAAADEDGEAREGGSSTAGETEDDK